MEHKEVFHEVDFIERYMTEPNFPYYKFFHNSNFRFATYKREEVVGATSGKKKITECAV